jgi:hypothetical protein
MIFFKKKRNSSLKSNSIIKHDNFIQIPSIGFSGIFSSSENGLFTIAWSDHQGHYLLLDNRNNIIFRGKIKRPNDGKVANNGTFILNDWLDYSEKTHGIFYAFDKSGNQIIKHSFKSNLFNNGISNDGYYAVCQTVYSKSSDIDNCALGFFDLNKNCLLWKVYPELGWANSYYFDQINKILYLNYDNLGKFRYDFSGNFLDDKQAKIARINNSNGYELYYMAEEIWNNNRENPTQEIANELSNLLTMAINKLKEKSSSEKDTKFWQAKAYRIQGELYESMNHTTKAIEYYELALKYNPKIGVKQKLSKLKTI